MVETMTKSRAEQAAALEVWAENVEFEDLKEADTGSLRAIAKVVDQRNAVADALWAAVRQDGRSWSEIATMLGVSKQAAQQKYGPMSAAS